MYKIQIFNSLKNVRRLHWYRVKLVEAFFSFKKFEKVISEKKNKNLVSCASKENNCI